jgi:hypothetical protein
LCLAVPAALWVYIVKERLSFTIGAVHCFGAYLRVAVCGNGRDLPYYVVWHLRRNCLEFASPACALAVFCHALFTFTSWK